MPRAIRFLLVVCTCSLASIPATAQPGEPEATPAYRIPDIPVAEIDEGLEIGGEEIDARKLRSRMTVDVEVNGEGPFKFVVDSGADTSVIGRRLADRLGLDYASPVLLHAMTESKVVERVEVDELQLGPTVTTDLELPVLRERDIGGDGMIGLDALVEQRLMMDFDRRIITVDDAARRERYTGGTIVVTARLQKGQLILTEVEVDEEAVDAVVDTGTEISIGNSALREKVRSAGTGLMEKMTIYGVTGKPQEIDFVVLPRLKIGPIELRKVPIAFADVPPFAVFGIDDKPSLLLGTDLMEQFRRVSLDFKERRVRFQLKRCALSSARLRTVSIATRIRSNSWTACQRR